MKQSFLTFALIFLCTLYGVEQQGILKTTLDKDSIINFRVFDTKTKMIDATKSKETIKELVHSGNNDDLMLQHSQKDELGITHYFYQQLYKGIKVENAMYAAHTKNGFIESVNGSFLKVGEVEINAKLSEKEALDRALGATQAQSYKWQIDAEEQLIKKVKNDKSASFFPKGELVIFYNQATKGLI